MIDNTNGFHAFTIMETKDGKQAIYAPTRAEWRNWLENNSQVEKSVWLIMYHKKKED